MKRQMSAFEFHLRTGRRLLAEPEALETKSIPGMTPTTAASPSRGREGASVPVNRDRVAQAPEPAVFELTLRREQ